MKRKLTPAFVKSPPPPPEGKDKIIYWDKDAGLAGESGEKFKLQLDLRDSRRPKQRLFGGGGWNVSLGLFGSG